MFPAAYLGLSQIYGSQDTFANDSSYAADESGIFVS